MTKNDEKKPIFKRLSLKHKNLIDLVADGATYTEASMRVCPEHAGWSSNAHSAYVSRILMSDLGQQYYQERLLEIEQIKENALRERYQNPMWSFDDSVQHLKMVVNLAKEELSINRERFKNGKSSRLMAPTCVNALLNAISMLNKMYRYDTNETPYDADARKEQEQQILALKTEKERLELEKQIILLDREKGEMCYNETAVNEFSRSIKIVHDIIERLPMILTNELNFTPEQRQAIFNGVEGVLEQLSNVKVDLSSSKEIDKKVNEMVSHTTKASKRKQV